MSNFQWDDASDRPPLRYKPIIVLLLLMIVVPIVVVPFVWDSWVVRVFLSDGTVNANTWVGFIGSIVSALLGSISAVLVLMITLNKQDQMRREESDEREAARSVQDRKLEADQRRELVQRLGDVVGTTNIMGGINLPELGSTALEAKRLVSKIEFSWLQGSAPGGAPYGNGLRALHDAARDFNEIMQIGLDDQRLNWLKVLLPAMEGHTQSMVYEIPEDIELSTKALRKVLEEKPVI